MLFEHADASSLGRLEEDRQSGVYMSAWGVGVEKVGCDSLDDRNGARCVKRIAAFCDRGVVETADGTHGGIRNVEAEAEGPEAM